MLKLPLKIRRRSASKFASAEAGAVVVEFALIMMIMPLIIIGFSQVARAAILAHKIQLVATVMGQILSQKDVVTAGDVQSAWKASLLIVPDLWDDSMRRNTDWRELVEPAVSSIKFVRVTGDGAYSTDYDGVVDWSWAYDQNNRRCVGAKTKRGTAKERPLPYTLPAELFGPGTIVAVEIRYNYAPIIPLYGNRELTATAYFKPRLVDEISVDTTSFNGSKGKGSEPGFNPKRQNDCNPGQGN